VAIVVVSTLLLRWIGRHLCLHWNDITDIRILAIMVSLMKMRKMRSTCFNIAILVISIIRVSGLL